jgi:hypothetical protein
VTGPEQKAFGMKSEMDLEMRFAVVTPPQEMVFYAEWEYQIGSPYCWRVDLLDESGRCISKGPGPSGYPCFTTTSSDQVLDVAKMSNRIMLSDK